MSTCKNLEPDPHIELWLNLDQLMLNECRSPIYWNCSGVGGGGGVCWSFSLPLKLSNYFWSGIRYLCFTDLLIRQLLSLVTLFLRWAKQKAHRLNGWLNGWLEPIALWSCQIDDNCLCYIWYYRTPPASTVLKMFRPAHLFLITRHINPWVL